MVFTEQKVYKQTPGYTEAQVTEKHRFQRLLSDLCRGGPPRYTRGMKQSEYDEAVRRSERSRRKFWLMVWAGIPFGLVLGYYLLQWTR